VLGPIRTKRRITLTGTPFVNNLKVCNIRVTQQILRQNTNLLTLQNTSSWQTGVDPELFGTFARFEKTYAAKIMAGLASDSTCASGGSTSSHVHDALQQNGTIYAKAWCIISHSRSPHLKLLFCIFASPSFRPDCTGALKSMRRDLKARTNSRS
jgi:hypothetical protein